MSWRTAKSLDVLLRQVDAAYPGRDKSSDGTIGDERHQATKSEHNPDAHEIVRARDITNDPAHGLNARSLAEALIASRDPRILYVISNAQICSSKVQPWVWRPYSGVNAHRAHMHLSVVEDPALYDDERPWDISAKTSTEPDKTAPLIPLDQRTIDAIAAAAASSDLARYTWGGRGRAPLGYIQGIAVVYGQVLRRLAAGDSVARAMVRVVNGSGDVFDHYQSILVAAGMPTLGAPDIDRLRALFVILAGLGIRESSGGDDIGRDTSASNTTADTAEAGTWQQSWDSRGASPELPKLFAAYVGSAPDDVDEIFKRGTSPKPSAFQNFGEPESDGYKFQALVKARPSIAALFAAVGMRTRYTHWGPLIHWAAEVVPAADVLFRQVQTIVGASPKPGEPMATIDPNQRLAAIADVLRPEWTPTAPGSPAPVTPPPTPIAGPAPVTPAAPSSPLQNILYGLAGSLGALTLGANGTIGTPIGPDATTTGLLTTVVPIITGLMGWNVPAVNTILGLFGGKKA